MYYLCSEADLHLCFCLCKKPVFSQRGSDNRCVSTGDFDIRPGFPIATETSSPKGNDAHLRAIIQSEKKWKHQFFRRLRAANSVFRGRIWPNFKLIKLLCMSSLLVSMKRIPSRTTRKKWQHRFSNYNTICCHGNQWSDLAEFRTHPSFYACPHCLQV